MVPLTLARQNGTLPKATYIVRFTFHIRTLWNCPITPCIFEKEKSLQCSLNGLARAATTRSPIGMTCRETREPWPAWETVCGVVLVDLRPPANLMNLFLIGLRSQFDTWAWYFHQLIHWYHFDILITCVEHRARCSSYHKNGYCKVLSGRAWQRLGKRKTVASSLVVILCHSCGKNARWSREWSLFRL